MTMKLYDYPLSGNCFKVRQMLAWLGLPYQTVPVDFFPGRAHKSAAFLANVNPLGQLPVIDDDGFVLRDAQAILVYLASRYGPPSPPSPPSPPGPPGPQGQQGQQGHWYPADPKLRGQVAMWLATADEITRTASAARLHDALGYHHLDIEACRAGARAVFRVLDDHLAEQAGHGLRWLASAPEPTIADLACFPYVALAGEGGISLDEFPALRNWVWDFRHLHGFIGMSGIFPAGPA